MTRLPQAPTRERYRSLRLKRSYFRPGRLGHDSASQALYVRAMQDQRAANAVDRHIGRRLRERRLAIGMSQETLADLLGVTFQQIQKYEKGVNRIAASRLYSMAKALEIDITHFFEGVDDGKSRRKRVRKAG